MSDIALMDCNNFFVSCERLFRPDLLGKPVAVLSSNDGCIVARSQEVKDLGIPMGVPYFEVRDICKKERITLFSSNFKLYRDISDRVMQTLLREASQVEIYSVDEAFFDASGLSEEKLYLLRETIMREVGIPVSIGISSTKTLAKVANNYAKKGTGVCVLNTDLWNKKRGDTSCGSIWGIGRKMTARLTQDGIHTVDELLSRGVSYARDTFGVHGERIYLELSGVSAHGDQASSDNIHQSIRSTRSFHAVVHEKSVLESALGHHVTQVGKKLREREHMALRLGITVAPGRYSNYLLRRSTAEVIFAVPTADTHVLLQEALKLLNDLYDPEVPYKKAGVTVGGIVPCRYVSPSLFRTDDSKDLRALYTATDHLNRRFGNDTIRPATLLQTDKWRERATLKSQEYTTSWKDIRRVRAL